MQLRGSNKGATNAAIGGGAAVAANSWKRILAGLLGRNKNSSGAANGALTPPIPPTGSYNVVYPRGPGAASGPLPDGYTYVSRWMSRQEARLWLQNQGTAVPNGVGGAGGRVYFTTPGAPKPGGTGPIRVDLALPEAALQRSGSDQWRQDFQPIQSTPIHNTKIHVPSGVTIPTR